MGSKRIIYKAKENTRSEKVRSKIAPFGRLIALSFPAPPALCALGPCLHSCASPILLQSSRASPDYAGDGQGAWDLSSGNASRCSWNNNTKCPPSLTIQLVTQILCFPNQSTISHNSYSSTAKLLQHIPRATARQQTLNGTCEDQTCLIWMATRNERGDWRSHTCKTTGDRNTSTKQSITTLDHPAVCVPRCKHHFLPKQVTHPVQTLSKAFSFSMYLAT